MTVGARSLILLSCLACTQENGPLELPAVDAALFRCEVQPVLVRQCSTPACHGTDERYYRLYARNRLRYGIDALDRADPLTEFEIQANYDATRALLLGLGTPEASMLLKKPLDERAGGYFHGATTVFTGNSGYNVFASATDTELATITRWALGGEGDPNCVDPGAEP